MKREYIRTGHRLVKNMHDSIKKYIERLSNLRINFIFQKYISKFTPNKHNNKKLWKMSRILKGRYTKLSFLKKDDSVLLTNKEKADALSDSFLNNHTITNNTTANSFTARQVKRCTNRIKNDATRNIDPTTFTKPKEVKEIIRLSPNNKAPGEDTVTNLMLKESSRKTIIALMYIMNACIMLSYFPDKWKSSTTMPIHKPGKPTHDVSAYRPISLLSCIS